MGALGKAIGQRIRKFRQAANLTLEKAAHSAGMDPGYWGRVERAEKNVTVDNLERMLQALGIEGLEIFSAGKSKDKEEEELVKTHFRKLSRESRKLLMAIASHLARTGR